MNVLNEEQSMMVEAARRFVREQIIAPRLDMALDRSAEFPHAIIEAMWEQGLLNGEFHEFTDGEIGNVRVGPRIDQLGGQEIARRGGQILGFLFRTF